MLNNPGPSFSTKQKQLRDLNTKTRTVQVALNQAASALAHAQRLLEDDYNRSRTKIISEPDPVIFNNAHGIDT